MDIHRLYAEFPDQKACLAYLERLRWDGKPCCPYCGCISGIGKHEPNKAIPRYRCYNCRKRFSVTVGTVFHGTRLPLQQWFLAIGLMLNSRKGISSMALSRTLGLHKEVAWTLGMRIRRAMAEPIGDDLLHGIVEMDETYLRWINKGEKAWLYDKHGGGHKHLVPLVGAVETGGRVTANVTDPRNLSGKDMREFVRRYVETGQARMITDGYSGYRDFRRMVPHKVIVSWRKYQKGKTQTNSIEGFWSIVKRGIFGQYHHVTIEHLQAYVDEFCFRYNLRYHDPDKAFEITVRRCLETPPD